MMTVSHHIAEGGYETCRLIDTIVKTSLKIESIYLYVNSTSETTLISVHKQQAVKQFDPYGSLIDILGN